MAALACPRCRGRLADGIPAEPFQPTLGRYVARLAASGLWALLTRLFGQTPRYRYDLRACQSIYWDLHYSWKQESLAREEEEQADIRGEENERKPDSHTGECEALSQSRKTVWSRHTGLLDKYQLYVDIMLRTANGRILQDEYGDEVWKGADKDIDTVIDKISAKEDGAEINDYSLEFLVRCDPAHPDAYSENWLFDELLDRLVAYHNDQPGTVKDLDTMSGLEFEQWLIAEIKQAGVATVTPTKRTGDQGADIIVQHNDITIAIQAKCYRHSVGNGAIQEIHAAKTHYRANQAWAVTNARFTTAARRLANSTGVQLVDGSRIHAVGQLIAEALSIGPRDVETPPEAVRLTKEALSRHEPVVHSHR